MRIAILTELYLPHVGGQEYRYAELAQALISAGHAVDIYTIRHCPGLPASEVLNGVRVRRYPTTRDFRKPLFPALKRKQLPMWLYALWVRYRFRAQDYDIVLMNQWPLSHILLASAELRRKAIIDWCELRDGGVFRFIQRRFPHMAAANIAVSAPVAKQLESTCGRPVHCIPSGIWRDRYHGLPREQRDGLIYLGRLTEHKNIPLLIEAYELLRNRGYKGSLTIAGEGPSSDEIKNRAARSAYRTDIHFPGFVDEAQKRSLLASAEVLVIPSRREGFPRVVAEAMASGLPVATVGYSENGTCDVVNQYQIGEAADTNADSLAETVLSVCRKWETYSMSGYTSCQELNWSELVRALERISRDVSAPARHSRVG
jgi:glycosyltransferase involved in cell wall biosynthesis